MRTQGEVGQSHPNPLAAVLGKIGNSIFFFLWREHLRELKSQELVAFPVTQSIATVAQEASRKPLGI